ncbi:hypothetical protein XA68_16235 [Ophiocordyceps unilateralis]|uniref:DUF7137 domain-containing protein n=1 Tax=Ophiocordyceps unilateralis TaxID=268505 RepID=A0A2A9PLM7_OPHUN|nr:hypothetical protein XA68_16235 [Ophiocordyceps unilateralis]
MRPAPSLVSLAFGLGSLVVAAAGSNWDHHAVVARADGGPTSSMPKDAAVSPTDSAKSDESPASATSGPRQSRTATDSNSAEPTGSDKPTGSDEPTATKDGDGKGTHTGFPPDAPPGGINMLTPLANLEPTPLYRIRQTVTWGWNYTSLLGTPTAIDIMVSCAVAAETWTLTRNMSFATSVNYVWDTNEQANSVETPLLTQMYTLIVKDSDADINAPPEPGYLGTAKNFFSFGLYAGQTYTPFSDWKCTGCSGAAAVFDRQAVGLALVTSTLTVLSFTWFVAGLGLH